MLVKSAQYPLMKPRCKIVRNIVLAALLVLFMAAPAFGETAVVDKSWLRLRGAPSMKAKAIGLVYGNDIYSVLKTKGEWIKVRTATGQVGWIAQADTFTPGDPPPADPQRSKELSNVTALQRLGWRGKAATGLASIAESYPGTFEYHEAVRHLLYYYPISDLLKPSDHTIHPASARAAPKVAKVVLECANSGYKPVWIKPWLMIEDEENEGTKEQSGGFLSALTRLGGSSSSALRSSCQ